MRAAAAAAKGTGQASGSARAQVAQLFAEALSVLPRPEGDGVLDPAAVGRAIEEALLELCGGTTKEYKNKYLSLYTSLKNEKNPLLRERVLRGELDAARLVRMTAQELAPAELIEQQRKSREYHMAAITINAARQDATTDMFQCGRCKERKTTYYQMQTRSADEPMTTFITCVNCGHRWKQG
jgi:transcription elongation factor S-II